MQKYGSQQYQGSKNDQECRDGRDHGGDLKFQTIEHSFRKGYATSPTNEKSYDQLVERDDERKKCSCQDGRLNQWVGHIKERFCSVCTQRLSSLFQGCVETVERC